MILKALAWSVVKPMLKQWLASRALRIPKVDAVALAARCGISVDALYVVNDAVAAHIISELDGVKL